MSTFELRTLAEIEAKMNEADDAEFLIDGVVSSAMSTILGETWIGKTFLALQLVDSLTTGQPFLERRVRGKPRLVAWLSTDPWGERTVTRRARTMGLDMDKIYAQSFYTPSTAQEWIDGVDELLAAKISVVVIDNTTDLSEDPNAPRETKLITDGLRRMVDAGIAVINLHHDSGNVKKPEFASRLWGKATRLRLTLTGDPFESPGPRTLTAQPNDGVRHEWKLHFDPEHSPVFTIEGEASADELIQRRAKRKRGSSPSATNLDDERFAQIVDREWKTQREIAEHLKVDPATVTRLLKAKDHHLRSGRIVPKLARPNAA